MAIVTRTGKGANLTANEVDNNFLELSGSIRGVLTGTSNAATASLALTAVSASYALTASYAMNGGGGGGGVSYTSYVATISGDSPVTSSVFENTTGKTFTWASGSTYEAVSSYTTTVSSVDSTKIAVFLTGEAVLVDFKGINVVFPKPAHKITRVNSTTATIDIFYDKSYGDVPVGTPVTIEARIYP